MENTFIQSNVRKFYDQYKEYKTCNLKIVENKALEKLYNKYKTCVRCDLHKNRVNIVPGRGVYNPLVMFIGLFPSSYESEYKQIFSDVINTKINGIVEYLSAKLKLESNVYYTNLLLCPYNSTNDLNEAINQCNSRLMAEIKEINPKNIILMGSEVAKHILNITDVSDAYNKAIVHQLDKFYKFFVIHSLKELMFKKEEVRYKMKDSLDYIIKCVENDIRRNK